MSSRQCFVILRNEGPHKKLRKPARQRKAHTALSSRQRFVILRNEGPHKKLRKAARQSKIKQSLAQWQLDKVKAHKINNKTLWSCVVELIVWSFVPQDDKTLSSCLCGPSFLRMTKHCRADKLCRSAMITKLRIISIYFFVDFSSLTSFISVAIFSFFSSMSSSLASASSL